MLASDLVNNLHVAVIAATGGGPSALAAKAATKTIPIVFTYAADPVKAGIVTNLNRPEENISGVTWFGGDLAGKRLALLHDVAPTISTIGLLINPNDPEDFSQRADAQDAARRFNLKLIVMNASTEREVDAAFATFAQQQVEAVVVGSDPLFLSRREQIVSLATRHRMRPTGVGSCDRLTNGLSVGHVVLLPFDVRLHIGRRCKSRKLQCHEFFAKTRSGRRSPIRIPSIALPKSPVSFA